MILRFRRFANLMKSASYYFINFSFHFRQSIEFLGSEFDPGHKTLFLAQTLHAALPEMPEASSESEAERV